VAPGGEESKRPLRELRKAEVRGVLARAMGELHAKLGRLPTVGELSSHSGIAKRTTYRYESALFAGLPYEFLDGLRGRLADRPAEESNRESLVRALLALTRSLPAGQVRLAQDRATVSAYVPETAVIRYEGYHTVWRPVLLDDLVQRRRAAGEEENPFEDWASVYRLFAAMELALEAWHEAGPELHPGEFLERALADVFPEVVVEKSTGGG
jgi:hypothetical protein